MTKRTCPVDGCGHPVHANGRCRKHYDAERRPYTPPSPICSEPECDRKRDARGLCKFHYMVWYKSQAAPCLVEGCGKPGMARGMCRTHYARWTRHGDPLIVKHRFDGYSRGCDIENCEQSHYGRGLCKRHYRKQYPKTEQPWNARRRANAQKRRALKKAAPIGDPVVLAEIRERDQNRCGICGKRVNGKPYPHPLSASLDHIVPLSHGGAHDPANVQLAHLSCNVQKGNRGGGEQLMLCG